MKKVTKQNKSEMGMNRNDFFEYKKNRIVEMVKKGASINAMAKDLGLDERDVYAFLSRNFGGIRNLRNFVSQNIIPEFKNPILSVDEKKKNTSKATKSYSQKKEKSLSAGKSSSDVMDKERERILKEFKNILEKDSLTVADEVKRDLDQIRGEILRNFKADIARGLSGLASSL